MNQIYPLIKAILNDIQYNDENSHQWSRFMLKKKKDLLSEQPHAPLKLLILDTKMMSEDWYLHLWGCLWIQQEKYHNSAAPFEVPKVDWPCQQNMVINTDVRPHRITAINIRKDMDDEFRVSIWSFYPARKREENKIKIKRKENITLVTK